MAVQPAKYRGFRVTRGDATGEQLAILVPTDYRVLHVASAADEATDWNVANPTHPTVYVHSETTPATDYIAVSHDGTSGFFNVVGGTLALQVSGTTEVLISSTAVTLATSNLVLSAGNISATDAALNATTGRIGAFIGTMATPNLGDGYGAVEIDVTFTGNYAGISAALSAWVNVTGTGAVGSFIVAAQNNGIYADTGANTGSIVIFGMRAQGILTDAPTVFAPFSLNTSNRAITALFHMNANPDVGYLANSGTSGGKVGDVPLFCDNAGQQYFVRIHSARG